MPRALAERIFAGYAHNKKVLWPRGFVAEMQRLVSIATLAKEKFATKLVQ